MDGARVSQRADPRRNPPSVQRALPGGGRTGVPSGGRSLGDAQSPGHIWAEAVESTKSALVRDHRLRYAGNLIGQIADVEVAHWLAHPLGDAHLHLEAQ